MIKDSGNRTEFETGAVRDLREGKGRCDLIPLDIVADLSITRDTVLYFIFSKLEQFKKTQGVYLLYEILEKVIDCGYFDSWESMVLELSIHFEEGAKKYGENNWQKGIPINCYLDSAVRHFLKCIRGDDDENHKIAFVWNIVCLIWTKENIYG